MAKYECHYGFGESECFESLEDLEKTVRERVSFDVLQRVPDPHERYDFTYLSSSGRKVARVTRLDKHRRLICHDEERNHPGSHLPSWHFAYMVRESIWKEAFPDYLLVRDHLRQQKVRSKGFWAVVLCPECLSKRLGRPLTLDDFTWAPINDWFRLDADELMARRATFLGKEQCPWVHRHGVMCHGGGREGSRVRCTLTLGHEGECHFGGTCRSDYAQDGWGDVSL